MSAISGYDPNSYYQYLQALNHSQLAAQNAAGARAAAAQSGGEDAAGSAQGSYGSPRGGYGGGPLFQQLATVVTSALQTAKSSGSGADPNQVIQSAIAQVIKNQPNPPPGNPGQAPPPDNDPDGDGDTDTPGVADSDGSSAQAAFTQLLQSNGVNAQQFQADFLAAVQSAQSGDAGDATDPSGALSSFPPGSLVDTYG
ncbi:MAG: hypothetical protein ABSH22_11490 [Tepidisphaeraceae bacterium]|jgi:hypothetical protein